MKTRFRQYRDEVALRSRILGDPNAVNLHKLPDAKCKKCYGRGFTDVKIAAVNLKAYNEATTPEEKEKFRDYTFCECLMKNWNKLLKEKERENQFK